jgi:hypothetical protein
LMHFLVLFVLGNWFSGVNRSSWILFSCWMIFQVSFMSMSNRFKKFCMVLKL